MAVMRRHELPAPRRRRRRHARAAPRQPLHMVRPTLHYTTLPSHGETYYVPNSKHLQCK